MGRSTSLHPDAAGRRLGEETKHLAPAQLTRHRRRAFTLDRMHLEKVLRQVDPNPDKAFHGRLPYPRPATGHALALDAVRVRPSTSSLRRAMATKQSMILGGSGGGSGLLRLTLAIVSWTSVTSGCPRRKGCADSGGRPNRRAGRLAVSQSGVTPAVILVVFPLSSNA